MFELRVAPQPSLASVTVTGLSSVSGHLQVHWFGHSSYAEQSRKTGLTGKQGK